MEFSSPKNSRTFLAERLIKTLNEKVKVKICAEKILVKQKNICCFFFQSKNIHRYIRIRTTHRSSIETISL